MLEMINFVFPNSSLMVSSSRWGSVVTLVTMANCKSVPHNSKHTKHGYKTHHSTVTVLHTANNIVAKGFKQMAPPVRTITVALDMSKAFDTINIQTKIPGTLIKFIASYIKGHNIYKSHILTTSIQNWRSTRWRSTRWRPFTNNIQHLHCRHTTTQSTGSGHGLRR